MRSVASGTGAALHHRGQETWKIFRSFALIDGFGVWPWSIKSGAAHRTHLDLIELSNQKAHEEIDIQHS